MLSFSPASSSELVGCCLRRRRRRTYHAAPTSATAEGGHETREGGLIAHWLVPYCLATQMPTNKHNRTQAARVALPPPSLAKQLFKPGNALRSHVRAATPPTTPPTIAPVLLLLLLDCSPGHGGSSVTRVTCMGGRAMPWLVAATKAASPSQLSIGRVGRRRPHRTVAAALHSTH